MKDAILVLGYNNTRINDVAKIRNTAKKCLGAITILCKLNPTTEDLNAADGVIDVPLDASQENLELVLKRAQEMSINIIGLLPFSDPGTQLGAILAKHLNLPGSDLDRVPAALDKYLFRTQENLALEIPDGYKKIQSKKITSYEELLSLFNKMNGNIFIKPAKEGNSRGCISLDRQTDLMAVWKQLLPYLDAGVVAEELIKDAQEYSWDHVSGYSWITEKETTTNQYRAEIQQIVPAPLNEKATNILKDTGRFMSKLSGSHDGACHNEMFFISQSNQTVAVEPNLRPAGMRIWDLAGLAFDNFDPWESWLLWSSRKNFSQAPLLKRNYYAGIRMIQAPNDGILQGIPSISTNSLSTNDVECIEICWTKQIGNPVTNIVKDNSAFIGYIIARSKNYVQLSQFLESTCLKLQGMSLINQ